MSAPGLTSSIRKETFENLQLNAGIFIKNLDFSAITDATALKAAIVAGTNILGATRGGGSFVASREMRTPEVDGMRYKFKGSDFIDSVEAHLATTLIEITPDTVILGLGTATKETNGKRTTIRMHTAVRGEDYINSLTWFGDLADGRLIAITLFNALNTTDFNLTFTDKSEGTLPVELHARQEDVLDYDYAPFQIDYFEPDGEFASLTVTSAAGTNVGETALSTTYTLASGEHFAYKVGDASNAPTIGYNETPDYTWTEWNGSSAINVGTSANGYKAALIVVTAAGKATKYGTATLAVKLT